MLEKKCRNIVSFLLCKSLKQAAKKDMREWPPSSVPIFYQPKRPMCDKPETQAED